MAKSHRDALALDSFVGFGSFSLSGVLLGSMGMDIRWTSKKAPYVAATFAVLLGCACMAAGLKLRKGQRLEPSDQNRTPQALGSSLKSNPHPGELDGDLIEVNDASMIGTRDAEAASSGRGRIELHCALSQSVNFDSKMR